MDGDKGAERGLPAWTLAASRRRAFARGAFEALSTPGLIILFFAMLGFGALTHDLGISAGQALFMTAAIFQLPGQVALVDQLAHDAALGAAAFAVMLTAVRMLPMTVVLMPYLRGSGLPRIVEVLGVHFVAITAWIESLRRLPELPVRLRLPYFLGFGGTLCLSTMLATLVGHQMAGVVPPVVTAAMLFLTPVYFIVSLLATARDLGDAAPLVIGLLLGPLFYLLAPGFDLMLTGLIGGTGAYLIGRAARRRRHVTEPGA